MSPGPRIPAALLGAGLGTLPGVLLGHAVVWQNPWFVDHLPSFLGLMVALPMVLGALMGAALGRGKDRGLVLGIGLANLALILLRPTPAPVTETRLLVFGIDGASWALADRLDLPTLEALADRGSRGVLQSDVPTFSPLLWTTMATGQPPEVHQVRGFRTRADLCRAPRFWDIAAAHGMGVGVYKWLVAWPPTEPASGGFVVPAWLAPTPETVPAELSFVKELELSRRLKRRQIAAVRPGWRLALAGLHQGLRWSTLLDAAAWSVRERTGRPTDAERSARLQLLRVAIDRDVFIAQLHAQRPAVATFTTYATDALGHSHWGLMEDCAAGRDCPPWGRAIEEAYGQADQVLAETLANLGPEVHVLVVSDHGFRSGAGAGALPVLSPKTAPLQRELAAALGQVDVGSLGHKAVVSLQGADPAVQRAALQAWSDALVRASTGAPLFTLEDLPGGTAEVGLTVAQDEASEAEVSEDTVSLQSGAAQPLSHYVGLSPPDPGVHDLAGILLAAGPRVGVGEVLPPSTLLDVAPTALGLLDLPVGADMGGRALFGETVPRVESWQALAAGRAGAAGASDVNIEMLRELGYLR